MMEPQRSSKLQPDMGVCVCGNGMFRWVRRVERKTGTPNEIFRAVREIDRKGNHNSVPYIESNNPYACSNGLFSFKMLLNVFSRFKSIYYYFARVARSFTSRGFCFFGLAHFGSGSKSRFLICYLKK